MTTSKRVSGASYDADQRREISEALRDRYELGDAIGAGATAVVYRAFDRKHRRDVAIKVLHSHIAATVGRERFQQEIDVIARLSHPHVLGLFDSGEAAGRLFYVTPLVDGSSLRALMEKSGALRLDEAIRITREVASALQFAHDRGVVHRDVKPENILLTRDGSAVLADFGLARVLEDVPSQRLTIDGVTVGTVLYMSPEQSAGERIDGRTDLYALACVLYEMLAGDPPFQGRSAQNVAARHRNDARPDVRHVRDSVPGSVADAILKAMARHASDRYARVADFSHALEAAVSSDGLTAGQRTTAGSPPAALTSMFRGRRILIVAGVVVLAAVATWIGRARRSGSVHLDPDLVAVAPFEVLGIQDTLWRQGMVDVLSPNFDGAGRLRAVPTSAVVRNWTGRVDLPSALALARRTGAGIVLHGQLLAVGNDSVRIRAWLTSVVDEKPIGDVDRVDDLGQISRLADTATWRLLTALGGARPIAAMAGRSLRASSLQALKAFLVGEQAVRRNDYKAAGRAYEQAVTLDTGFALAYHGLREVRRALGGNETDSLSLAFGLRAGVLNQGLATRDSLLLLNDSLASTLPNGAGFYDDRSQTRLRRRLEVVQRLARTYPENPAGHMEHGELLLHLGFRLGIRQDSALAGFERAIAADSGFAPAYYHAIELALTYRTVDSCRALIRRYLRVQPLDRRFRAIDQLLSSSKSDHDQAWRIIDAMPTDSVMQTAYVMRRWRANPDIAFHMYRSLLGRPALSVRQQFMARGFVTAHLLVLGRVRESWLSRDSGFAELLPINIQAFFRYGPATQDSLSQLVRDWSTSSAPERWRAAAEFYGATGHGAELDALVPTIGQSMKGARTPQDSISRSFLAGAARAYRSLASNDSATARRLFVSLPDSLCPWTCWPEIETTVRLLVQNREVAQAAQLLDRHPPPSSPAAMVEIPWLAARINVARRLGDMRTVNTLGPVLDVLWRGADSSVRRIWETGLQTTPPR